MPTTGDDQLDDKIATALHKYQDLEVAVRREALEPLWDAFERVKTVIDPTDKKRSTNELIDLMASNGASRRVIAEEFSALTRLGNDFQIRHHEVVKHTVEPEMIDLLFLRALALVEGSVRAVILDRRRG